MVDGTSAKKRPRAYGSGSVSQRSSDGLWIASIEAGWTANNTRRRIKIAAKTKGEAQRKLKEKQREIALNGIPTASANSRTTVRTWAVEWLERTQHTLRPMTWKTNAGCVHKWIIPTIGAYRLDALTEDHVHAVDQAQRDAGLRPSSILRTHAVLKTMLKAAKGARLAVPDWALDAKRPQIIKSDRGRIPTTDALALLRAAGEQPDGSRWLFGMLYGMRQAEVLGLTWDAVNLDAAQPYANVSWQLQSLPWADRAAGAPRVPDAYEHRQVWKSFHLVKPKTEKGSRLVPLLPVVTRALLAWRDIAPANPAGLIWPRPDGTPRPAKVDNEMWRALQKTAGVNHRTGRPYGGHECRHTANTLLMEAGVDITVRKAILGHSSTEASLVYTHADQAEKRTALEAVAAKLQLG